MSPRTWLDRVRDILSCAKNIQEFTAGMMFPGFLEDPRTTRSVAFEFTTIGEAAPEDIPPLITALENIIESQT